MSPHQFSSIVTSFYNKTYYLTPCYLAMLSSAAAGCSLRFP
jgi:hypothetical protein